MDTTEPAIGGTLDEWGWSPRQVEAFFEALAVEQNLPDCCAAAGLAPMTVYRRRKGDPEFARRWAEQRDAMVDRLEHVTQNRAVEGYVETTTRMDGDGNVIERVAHHRIDTRLGVAMLERLRPRDYAAKQQVDVTTDGQPLKRLVVDPGPDETPTPSTDTTAR